MNVEGAAPVPTETVALELDTIGIIETVTNQLAGRIYDPSTNSYKEMGARMINELGEKELTTVLASYLSRDKILSNMTSDEIKETTKELSEALAIVLLLKYKAFEIDKANIMLVLRMIEHTVHTNLLRSKEGRTLDHIANIIKINEKAKEEGFHFPRLSLPFGGRKQEEGAQDGG
jgi:hypothetical protein